MAIDVGWVRSDLHNKESRFYLWVTVPPPYDEGGAVIYSTLVTCLALVLISFHIILK